MACAGSPTLRSGGFQTEHDTVEARRHHLYHPDRLAERFRLFESFALPGLKAQTDPDFELIVVTGPCLPTPAKARLRELTGDMPQVRIVEREPGRHRAVMKQILNDARRHPDRPCLHFRHDDDDAVAVDFIESLRQAAVAAAELAARNPSVAIDFDQGYLARFGPFGIQAKPVRRRLLGVGLGMLVQGGCPLTIMNFAHQRMGRFMPVVTVSDRPMWVRTFNGFNDSQKARTNRSPLPALGDAQRDLFRTRFAIDADAVRRGYSEA
ncbi:Putative rhamnosyl transferase [Ruegeria lacuscaerulensis ITI-1157]|nr:Putative rhamnosyl transferase [Ruegeria lacuscaerulensis ITI-1157]